MTSAFQLPPRLSAKNDPALIADDERHFAEIADHLEHATAERTARLNATRRSRPSAGGEALERDMEIRRLASSLRTLGRYGLDLCLGRMIAADGPEPVYVGRLGLTDATGKRLLIDWRSPAAEPFFGATHANPMGLLSRRRYRWSRGRITDYWDEAFTAEGLQGGAALDDQSAFIASLGTSRSARMRDVLGTIQADQDAIIRAGSRGALVVDGGPGTGKTVVALHRAAYLLYSDPRLARHHGGVLFVGPSHGYLAYVADVLPSLGEEGVQLCTLRDLTPEGQDAMAEPDAHVAALKSSSAMVAAIDAAVRYYEQPPAEPVTVETEWGDTELTVADWADAFAAVEPGMPHNDVRDQLWEGILEVLGDRFGDEAPPHLLRRAFLQDEMLRAAFNRAWPVLDPAGVVADLWSSAAYLRRCAPWLGEGDIRDLQRKSPRAWTVPDVPLLDTAHLRIGDPESSRRTRRQAAVLAAQREGMADAIEDLVRSAEHDDGEGVMTMLRQEGMQAALVDESAASTADPDVLAGPFAHIVIDEAQELTDAEWQMLLRRCPSRSFTIVGDRAQARHGFAESWDARLERMGLDRVEIATLTINYRTPEEVMAEAEPVIRSVLPDGNVPTSIRSSGLPVVHGSVAELPGILETWLAEHAEGIAAVIAGDGEMAGEGALQGDGLIPADPRIRMLTPELSKGLEFDLVVLIDPEAFGAGIGGAGIEGTIDRYVAMTRATQQLVVLSAE